MGVLGLNPFLQKACPHVFKSFPNRFKDLQGKRIIFDGTLITQRLHFAQTPHPYRHVLGWYRIIQELNESSVSAICIFDGKGRNAAKQREVERRRETRRTMASRGFLEKRRLVRLRRLLPLVQALNGLNGEAKMAVTEELRSVLQEASSVTQAAPSPERSSTESWSVLEDISPPLEANSLETINDRVGVAAQSPQTLAEDGSHLDPLAIRDKDLEHPDQGANKDVPAIPAEHDIPGGGNVPDPAEDGSQLDPLGIQRRGLEHPGHGANEDVLATPTEHNTPGGEDVSDPVDIKEGQQTELPPVQQPSFSVGSIKSVLTNLYTAFKDSLEKLASISRSDSLPPPISDDEAEDGQAFYTISKAQQELTDAEGTFWQHLCEVDSVTPDAIESAALSLLEKSSILVESYERRTKAPTTATYEQSKEILRAMGIPCIETDGPYEAEAVAAAMVLQGKADYVASEDTDVLVYGAPLIRGTSTKAEPLVTVSGVDIWKNLQLDQRQFIDFALLLGTDFSQRIKNIGPARALKFIREHGSIERIVERETQYPPRLPIVPYLHQVAVARLVFRTLPPVPTDELTPLPVDEAAVDEVMHKYDLSEALANEQQCATVPSLNGNYFNDSPSSL